MLEKIQKLLEEGANPYWLLHDSIREGDLESVVYLLDGGLDTAFATEISLKYNSVSIIELLTNRYSVVEETTYNRVRLMT